MTGHGMAIRGTSVRNAVFRAFYTQQNAMVQMQATLLGGLKAPEGLTPREATDTESTVEAL